MEFFEELKKHRESKKISLEEISEKTKINLNYLHAIEQGNFNVLPNVYMRLFLISYCKNIDVNYKKTLENYEKYTNTPNMSLRSDFKSSIKNHTDLSKKEDAMNQLDSNFSTKNIIQAIIVLMIIVTFFIIVKTLQKNSQKTLEKSSNSLGYLLKENNYFFTN